MVSAEAAPECEKQSTPMWLLVTPELIHQSEKGFVYACGIGMATPRIEASLRGAFSARNEGTSVKSVQNGKKWEVG